MSTDEALQLETLFFIDLLEFSIGRGLGARKGLKKKRNRRDAILVAQQCFSKFCVPGPRFFWGGHRSAITFISVLHEKPFFVGGEVGRGEDVIELFN